MIINILGNGSGTAIHRRNTSFLIRSKKNILVEVPKTISWLYEIGVDVDYVIVTHAHHDHYGDLEGLVVQKEFEEKKKMIIIIPPIYDIPILPGFTDYKYVKIYRDIRSYKDENLSVEFFEVKHTTKTFGVKIYTNDKCIGYSSDTEYPVVGIISNCDLILHDCAGGIHASEKEVYENSEKYGAKDRVRCIHVNDNFKPRYLKLAEGTIEI